MSRRGIVGIVCVLALGQGAPSVRAIEPEVLAAGVAGTSAEVVRAGRHPWLRWPDLADVAPALHDLYGGEADGLFWVLGGAA